MGRVHSPLGLLLMTPHTCPRAGHPSGLLTLNLHTEVGCPSGLVVTCCLELPNSCITEHIQFIRPFSLFCPGNVRRSSKQPQFAV